MSKYLNFLIVTMVLFFVALPVYAMNWSNFSLVPEACRGSQETANACGLNEVTQTAINASMLIMALIGSATLLMFVIGGVMYMTSGGSPDKVKKATSIITNAVIGLAIVLLAGAIVKVLISTLTGAPGLTNG